MIDEAGTIIADIGSAIYQVQQSSGIVTDTDTHIRVHIYLIYFAVVTSSNCSLVLPIYSPITIIVILCKQ